MAVFKRTKHRSSGSQSSSSSGDSGSGSGSSSSSLRKKEAAHKPLKSSFHSCDGSSSAYDSCLSGSYRSCKSQNSNPKNVRFSQVHVREYERSLGDNPSCSSGAPIGIGWTFQQSLVLGVEEYERHHKRGRPQNEIILSRHEREQLLREWCTTEKEIAQSTRDNLKIKFQRRRSVRNARKLELFHNTIFGKGIKKVLGFKGHKSDELLLHSVPEMGLVPQSPEFMDSHEEFLEVSEPEEEDDESDDGHLNARGSPRILRKQSSSFDDATSAVSGLTFGDSTTTSAYEMEMFHRELELEMFGPEPDELDESLPPRSMLGQTVTMPDAVSESNSMSIVSGSHEEEMSSSSSTTYSFQSPNYSYYGSPQMDISPVPAMHYSAFQKPFPQQQQQHYPHHTHHRQYNPYARTSAYRGYSLRDAYRGSNKFSAFDMANQQMQAPPFPRLDGFHVVEVTEPDDDDDDNIMMMSSSRQSPYPRAAAPHNLVPPMYPMMDRARNNNNYIDVVHPSRYSSDDSRNAFSDVRSWEEFYYDLPDDSRYSRSDGSGSSTNYDSSSMNLSNQDSSLSPRSYKSLAEISVDFSEGTNLTEKTQHC